MAIALALSSCDKAKTPEQPRASIVVPTGAIDSISSNATAALSQEYLSEVIRLTLRDEDIRTFSHSRGFTQDPAKPNAWHVRELTVGFGPRWEVTHVGTVKVEKYGTIKMYDMTDTNSDGVLDLAVYSISSTKINPEWVATLHHEIRNGVDKPAFDMYAAALAKAKEVLEAEEKIPEKESK